MVKTSHSVIVGNVTTLEMGSISCLCQLVQVNKYLLCNSQLIMIIFTKRWGNYSVWKDDSLFPQCALTCVYCMLSCGLISHLDELANWQILRTRVSTTCVLNNWYFFLSPTAIVDILLLLNGMRIYLNNLIKQRTWLVMIWVFVQILVENGVG